VFLKGCLLNCPWCANPETISRNSEIIYDDTLCIKKNNVCIFNIKCPALGKRPLEYIQCPANAISIFGNNYSNDDIFDLVIKDKIFYNKHGGITFSGGEPFLQLINAIPLLEKIRSLNINLCVETSLYFPPEYLIDPGKYFDIFYVDLKILSKKEAREIIKGDIELFLNNLDILFSFTHNVIYRIPLVENITATYDNLNKIDEVIKKYRPIKVEYFNIHNMAERKYKLLNKKMPTFSNVSMEFINSLTDVLDNLNIDYFFLKI
jgi:pyruvate formate lyase activating enzyme